MQTAEQEFVERIKLSRSTSEPEQSAISENTEAVNVSEDTPAKEVIEPEATANDEVTSETEEPAEAETDQATDDDEDEDLYVQYKGREINLKDVYKKEQEQLMQADYTRKTQLHAEDVKSFKVKEDDFDVRSTELNDKLAQLNAIINEDTPSAETLADWREYEPEKYIEHTEKMSNRKKLLAESKAELPVKGVDMVKVSADLFASHPEWMVDGKQSKQFTEDTNLMNTYAESRGIGQAEMVAFDARHYEIILDAARYKSQNNKNVAIAKKVRMAPVSTKPRAAANGAQTDLDAAKKAFRLNPSDKNAIAVRKIQRQLNN